MRVDLGNAHQFSRCEVRRRVATCAHALRVHPLRAQASTVRSCAPRHLLSKAHATQHASLSCCGVLHVGSARVQGAKPYTELLQKIYVLVDISQR